MDDFLKMDIFFVVTTVAVVVVALLLGIVLVRARRLLRTLIELAEEVKERAEHIGGAAEAFLERVEDSFVVNLLFPKKTRTRKKK